MKLIYTILVLLCCAFYSRAQIASDSFEGSSIFTITGGGYKSGNSGAADGPASSPFSTVGTQGYGCNNTTVTLISPVYDLSCYTGNSLVFRLASFSLTSAANGADGTDKVQVFISTNGGGAYTQYLEVDGNSNAYWSYAGGTGNATTAYPTVTTFAPAGGGSRGADGYSTLSITSLPSVANVVIKIVMLNNSANELWVIDDFKLQGTATGCNSITTGAVSPTSYSVDCFTAATGTVSFTSTGTFTGANVYTAQLSSATGSFASPVTIGTFTSTANSGNITITIPIGTATGTGYLIQIISNSPAVTGSASASFTVTNSCAPLCPTLTGAILNSCDLGTSGCNEGDAEVMFFNTGTYSVSVASLPSHVVNYYGSAANFAAPTIDAYTGTFSTNASATSTLNSSTGCSGGFIDGASAGTIPAGATVMMVPSGFCSTNYDFSNLCSSFSPIYVLYFSTAGWNSSGNLANHQTPSPKPKYITVDFSTPCGCPMEYYTYDADTENTGNGAGVSYPSSISTNSAVPISPVQYTSASCALPITLPVDLLSFTVKRAYTNEAELNYSTILEENIKKFTISKSYDGFTFTKVYEQTPNNTAGQFNYRQYDPIEYMDRPFVYYRLEEEDINGVKKIIGNCVLELKPAKEIFVTFNGDELNINTPVGLQHAELFNVSGNLVTELQGSEAELTYTMDMQGLPKGFYLLAVTDIFGKTLVKKVIR